MKILTYSLRTLSDGSDSFYRDAGCLTDDWLRHGESVLLPEARKLRRFVELTENEEARTVEEYAFDLLVLGVLWREYNHSGSILPSWQGHILKGMVRLRTQAPRLKPSADRIRASLGAKWLWPQGQDASDSSSQSSLHMKDTTVPMLRDLEPLLMFLEASGEFIQEAARIRLCQTYLKRQSPAEARAVLEFIIHEAAWFEEAALTILGPYTLQVDEYRKTQGMPDRAREDAILRSRSRVEYHLNLMGADLMNRIYRDSYKASSGHAVLLPTCLKARSGSLCAANRSRDPHHCLQCTPECRVSRIVDMGRQEGFEVVLVSHESDAFARPLVERLARERTGIVGVACALNLVSGGLRAKSAGIPAQCVILDYCGCKGHWDDTGGMPTDLNLPRLRQIAAPQDSLKPQPPKL